MSVMFGAADPDTNGCRAGGKVALEPPSRLSEHGLFSSGCGRMVMVMVLRVPPLPNYLMLIPAQ